jgi:hypothetical protein
MFFIQAFKQEKYSEVIVMEDKEIIKQLKKILGKASHQKTEYKKGTTIAIN